MTDLSAVFERPAVPLGSIAMRRSLTRAAAVVYSLLTGGAALALIAFRIAEGAWLWIVVLLWLAILAGLAWAIPGVSAVAVPLGQKARRHFPMSADHYRAVTDLLEAERAAHATTRREMERLKRERADSRLRWRLSRVESEALQLLKNVADRSESDGLRSGEAQAAYDGWRKDIRGAFDDYARELGRESDGDEVDRYAPEIDFGSCDSNGADAAIRELARHARMYLDSGV